MSKKTNLPNLETALTELDELIHKMQQGELTLEQSLAQFERGVQLIAHCQKTLKAAEQKVKILIQDNTGENLVDYPQETPDEGSNRSC
ncbi:MAG TPA: exodeoxyribonuclease VII small subunit [Gammaproteobacteria bacterium]|nr:exodeoxyribonuclease VII small subunit [Gammaproteobacteria bacterium]